MRMMRFMVVAALAFTVRAGVPVFEMPARQMRHKALREQFFQALRDGDAATMEVLCRQGCALLPDDPTWRYNLACSLARKMNKEEAFKVLEEAIELGYQDHAAIAKDPDMKPLAGDSRFLLLLKKAELLRKNPKPDAKRIHPTEVVMGSPATVSAANTFWNLDLSCFQTLFDLKRPEGTLAEAADQYRGPAANLVRPWFSDNTASGNYGDFYVNRDRGHSKLVATNYPGLTPILYAPEAKKSNADISIPNMFFPGPVIGNSSMSITKGAFWRSIPRMIQSEPELVATAGQFYLNNQMWVFPEHEDYDPEMGDLFPANFPCYVVSQGSSYSDLPFVKGFTSMLAAFRPETEAELVKNVMLAPTLQALFRRSLMTVKSDEDYLSGKAHPVVFNALNLDVPAMVTAAHDLKVDEIPPMVVLRVKEEAAPRPDIDYFDFRDERLFDSPFCIARIVRGTAYEKKIVVSAAAVTLPRGQTCTFTWRLLQGDPQKVAIKPLVENGSTVELTVGYHGRYIPKDRDGRAGGLQTSRVDIGCFARCGKGKYLSMPGMVSFCYLPTEERVYRKDGQIQSVDYTNEHHLYEDPAIAIQKGWKDLYVYDDEGRLTGWFRKRGTETQQFSYAGHRVMETDDQGRPTEAREVEYLPRKDGPSDLPPTLIQVDTAKIYRYSYKDKEDRFGKYE
ncbi:MAG: hypothetical protein J6334_05350 [Kiritimatiellae bacterium]|nr:hypothetical protein [Kiritimatiellia bacterium]